MVHLKSSLNRIPQQDTLIASQRQAGAQATAKLGPNFRKPGPSPSSTPPSTNTGDSSSNSTTPSFQTLFGGAQTASASPSSTTSSTASQQSMDMDAGSGSDSAPTVQSVFGSASPWLSDPTGTSPDGTVFDYNPEYFATPQAAAQVAAMLGGQVVQENQFAPTGSGFGQSASNPNGSPFGQSASNEMVQMPDGGLINAGQVAAFFTHGYPESVIDQMIANTIATT
jgi:hypothetical protein